jgi:hypothetical protein
MFIVNGMNMSFAAPEERNVEARVFAQKSR